MKPFMRVSIFLMLCWLITNCVPKRESVLESLDYNATQNKTSYMRIPYGTVTLPGKWTKDRYNSISNQQFFKRSDSTEIAISFSKINQYEFNAKGKITGYDFVKAFYEWEAAYFKKSFQYENEVLVQDSTNKYIAYRIFSTTQRIDSYFLIAERNGRNLNTSLSYNERLSKEEKLTLLKEIFKSW